MKNASAIIYKNVNDKRTIYIPIGFTAILHKKLRNVEPGVQLGISGAVILDTLMV